MHKLIPLLLLLALHSCKCDDTLTRHMIDCNNRCKAVGMQIVENMSEYELKEEHNTGTDDSCWCMSSLDWIKDPMRPKG